MTTAAAFGEGGKALWEESFGEELTQRQVAILTEACRARDRLDKLDRLLSGEVDVWARLVHSVRTEDYELHIDDALQKANTTATTLRLLLAELPAVKPKSKGSALDELAKRRAGAKPAPRRASAARTRK